MERTQGDKAIEIAAATVFAMELAKDAITLFLVAYGKTLDVATRFTGNDKLRVFYILHGTH
jgi:hypothetical protein